MSDSTKQTDQPAREKPAKMAIPADAPPGIELDSKGNLIPFEQRTKEDQERAKAGR